MKEYSKYTMIYIAVSMAISCLVVNLKNKATLNSLLKEFKNIIENYWWIIVAPDYLQFLFLLILNEDMCKRYLYKQMWEV